MNLFLIYILISWIFGLYFCYTSSEIIDNIYTYNLWEVIKKDWLLIFIMPLVFWIFILFWAAFYITIGAFWILDKLTLLMNKILD